MPLFRLDAVRNAEIDRAVEPLLEDVREMVCAYPWSTGYGVPVENVVEAFDVARPRLNVLASRLRHLHGAHGADISTGLGFLSVTLLRAGLRVTATERDPATASFAATCGVPVLPFTIGVSHLPFSPESLDFVVFSEVLEHLRCAPIPVLAELANALKPGGLCLLTTPNIARLAHVEALAAGENFLEPFPLDLPSDRDATDYIEHIREYSVREVADAVEGAGLAIEHMVMTGWGEAGYHPLANPYANEICVVVATR